MFNTRPSKDDKLSWTKNWIDAEEEVPKMTVGVKSGMITSYIKKIDSYKNEDLTKLLYTLRVRALIVIFFGLEDVEFAEEIHLKNQVVRLKPFLNFLNRDLSTHKGWGFKRNANEDLVIGQYQYAYALAASENYSEALKAFTTADKNFGFVRHCNYLTSMGYN